MKTVLELITETLVGEQCIFEGYIYTINKLTVDRGQMSVVIENINDKITVPMSAAQIEMAMATRYE